MLEQHNFSNQKQVELLQILAFALFKKHYPQDICGILEKKIQILHLQAGTSQKETPKDSTEQNPNIASIKVRAVIILEMLKQLQIGPANNDLTKICKLISFLTGNSYHNIYNELQKGICFSNFHTKQINEVNKILKELNASIAINKDKQY